MSQESADRDLAANAPAIPQTTYPSAEPSWPNRYIWPVLLGILEEKPTTGRQGFEAGWGNGATASVLASSGYRVTGVDPAVEGVEIARTSFPNATFHLGAAYDDLAGTNGTFPIVISLEVIEHCFSIKAYLETMFR